MGLIRESFVIFKNWAEAINALPEKYQLQTYKALVEYGFNGNIPKDLPPIVNAMLISFSAGMESSILRYNASVENGKRGGRPRKNTEEETQENLNKPSNNLEKPSKTQNNLDEPTHNLNVNVNVNDNVNVSSLLNNNARVREAKSFSYWKDKFKDFWTYGITSERETLANEVIEVITNSLAKVEEDGELKFNHKAYGLDDLLNLFCSLEEDDLRKIVWSLTCEQEIENRQFYILGSLLNRAFDRARKDEVQL